VSRGRATFAETFFGTFVKFSHISSNRGRAFRPIIIRITHGRHLAGNCEISRQVPHAVYASRRTVNLMESMH